MITINLPAALSALAEGKRSVHVSASTLLEAFDRLDDAAPMIRSQIFDATGSTRQFVALFINDKQIMNLRDSDFTIAPGSQISIVMSVAGG
jgi:molybdopterin converting factor small subunit